MHAWSSCLLALPLEYKTFERKYIAIDTKQKEFVSAKVGRVRDNESIKQSVALAPVRAVVPAIAGSAPVVTFPLLGTAAGAGLSISCVMSVIRAVVPCTV